MKYYLSNDLKKQAITSERERQLAILNSDEAKGRKNQAHHFCFETFIPSADAISIMRASVLDDPKPTIQTNPYLIH